MTDYRKVTVSEPEEAFSKLKDSFYVKEDNGDEIVLLVKEVGHPVKNNPVRNMVKDVCGSLDNFSAFGKPVWNQEDLPPELRDDKEYQEELKKSEPKGKLPDRDVEDMESILLVLDTIKQHESDSDHIYAIDNTIKRLREIYQKDVEIPNRTVRKSDVSVTLEILKEEGVEYTLKEHPNNTLAHRYDMVLEYTQRGDVRDIPEPDENFESVF